MSAAGKYRDRYRSIYNDCVEKQNYYSVDI